MTDLPAEKILILNFGSQYTQLIASRVHESKVCCEGSAFYGAPSSGSAG